MTENVQLKDQAAHDAAAKVADLSEDKVKLNVTLLGGGFGRRLEVDVVVQATQLAMAADGAPVQLVWSREQDMTHDYYRPMHVAQLSAAVNGQGQVESLQIKSAGDAISPRWMSRVLPALSGPIDAPDKTTAEGLFDLPYGFEHQRMSHVSTKMGVPIGFWRSVGHSGNAFVVETFIDQLAHAAKKDPVIFRRELLASEPRALGVLNLAAEKSGWGKPLPKGLTRGIAVHKSFGTWVAQVAEVRVNDNGSFRVERVVCAVDCGVAVNPDVIRAQMEGGIGMGLSAALGEAITLKKGVVEQSNFHNYSLLRIDAMPKVEVHIVASTEKPGGIGEPGTPPIAPAVANALFAATGKPMRNLPLKNHGLRIV